MSQKIAFSAAGDAIIVKQPAVEHAGVKRIRDFLTRADVRAVNLEVVLFQFDSFASAYCGGTWLGARPQAFRSLMAYGFNMYSCANNHIMDYSYEGLKSTLDTLDQLGVAHAGAGMNLYEASNPVYLDTPSGRVAMISICSTFNDAARAGEQSPQLPGRPGLNPLRYSKEYIVTREQYDVLARVARETTMNGYADSSMALGFTPRNREGTLYLDGLLFSVGDMPEKKTCANSIDIERTINTIKDALYASDHVIVMAHSHEIKGGAQHEPDYFFEKFCHVCIDAGASGVIGSGTHQLKPIEIYKDRPIFYSLGNFIYQSELIERLPPDMNEKYGFPENLLVNESIERRSCYGKRGLTTMDVNYRSVLPYWEITDGRLDKVILMPIELGHNHPKPKRGWPSIGQADHVLADLQNICRPYGTEFRVKDECVEVVLKQ